MWRLYVIPIVGSGSSRLDPRHPQYVNEAGLDWSAMDYGAIPWCLCAADTDTAQDAALTANADVRGLPDNLDQAVGGATTAVRNALEVARLPAGWVTSATTYRAVVRAVAGLLQFAQRYTAVSGGQELVASQAALDLRVNQLSAQRRADLGDAADSLGYDTSAITGTTTVRQALKVLADQWGDRPFVLGGLTF